MPRDIAPAAEERLRDADRSQSTILAAARDEFAEHGLGGARMDRIAERAGLNKRLIYYYFEDKEQLFQAVLEQAYLQIREEERKLNLLDLKPADARAPAGRIHLELLPGASRVPHRCSTAKTCTRARHLQDSERAREMNSPLIATLAEILERGRKDGSFRGGVDPLQLYVSIAGLSYFYLSNHHTLSAIFGRDLMTVQGARTNA